MQPSFADRWQENHLLVALSEKDRSHLLPHLEMLNFFFKESVHEVGEEMNYVYFPLDCIVVLVSAVDATATVESGLIGREGMLGAPILMGAKYATNQALILWEGKALRVPVPIIKKEFKRSSALREILLPYANALLTQSAQLVACHRYHTPRARLVRLLLMVADRSGSSELNVTQDFLAYLLGTRRATITNAANQLEAKDLVRCSRGRITILSRAGLESDSCECYRIISQHYRARSAASADQSTF